MSIDLEREYAEIKRRRQALTDVQIQKKSQCIVKHLKSHWPNIVEVFSKLKVAAYYPVAGEADILSLFESADFNSEGEVPVYFPRILDAEDGKMEFSAISAKQIPTAKLLDSNSAQEGGVWQKGKWNTLEPAPQCEPVDPNKIDVFFVPGLSFDPYGERKGMGQGFYDRYLNQCPHALRVGVAYDFQLVPQIEVKEWDEPMDWVLTESRSFKQAQFAEKWKKIAARIFDT